MVEIGQPKRIGVFGGSFNPVHLGHLVMAQDAREAFDLDKVVFMPCARSPHKGEGGLAPAADRYEMLRQATAGLPWAAVSDLEIRRGGVSYTVDTMRALKGVHPETELFFIAGADTLDELHLWREIGALLELCRFVTMARPGASVNAVKIALPAPWPARIRADVRTGHLIGISSTEIRERAARGASVRLLTPDAVAAYMEKKALYGAREAT